MIGPDRECTERGAKYCCRIERGAKGHTGTIWDERGSVRWRSGVRAAPPSDGRGNPFGKPDFVLTNEAGAAEVAIRRVSFIPSRFHILEGDTVAGRIAVRSLLRIRYSIEIDGTDRWTFRLPLFTVRFWGDCQSGPGIWVVVGPSKMQWNILLKPGLKAGLLVPALAFIHNEWWNYS